MNLSSDEITLIAPLMSFELIFLSTSSVTDSSLNVPGVWTLPCPFSNLATWDMKVRRALNTCALSLGWIDNV